MKIKIKEKYTRVRDKEYHLELYLDDAGKTAFALSTTEGPVKADVVKDDEILHIEIAEFLTGRA